MTRFLQSTRFLLFVLSVVFLATACNNGSGDKTNDKKDTTTEAKKSTSQTDLPGAALMSVTLDTLYTEADAFAKLPANKKVLFVLTFRNPDTLTLHGWSTRSGTCKTDPEIKLTKGPATALPDKNGIYLGNVKLDPNDVKKVKDS